MNLAAPKAGKKRRFPAGSAGVNSSGTTLRSEFATIAAKENRLCKRLHILRSGVIVNALDSR